MRNFAIKDIRFNKLLIIFLLPFLFITCTRTTQYSIEGWNLLVFPEKEFLTIIYEDLGVILKDICLNLRKENELIRLSGWKIMKEKGKLTIITKEPDSTNWVFIITEEGLNINSSIDNGIITGIAPAPDGRIPARIARQDNGVIYTSLGFVTVRGIYNLFDRATNIMIQFPEGCDLKRNENSEELMDVTFSLLPSRGSKGRGGRTHRGIEITQDNEISLIRNYYTDELGLSIYKPYYPQFKDKHPFKTAPTGWLSWYCYYMITNEEDMIKETDALAKSLKPYGLEYIQLDACYTKGKDANWLEWNKEAFPKGGKWLMQYIKEKGLKPGLWLNAYGANYSKPEFSDKYPENWFLHDRMGNLIGACCTADSTVVKLDYSNPKVIEKHLKPLFRILKRDWGIEYLKDAGHARWIWTYEENRERAYNPSINGIEAYWKVQAIIRDIMGPRNWLMGCDAEGGADKYSLGFGIFDSSFNIFEDVYAVWETHRWGEDAIGTKMHLATIFCTNYLNDIVVYNDPDATMIRSPITMEEAKNNVSTIALTGQSYMISDFISDLSLERILSIRKHTSWGKDYPHLVKKLPDERLELYKKTMPTMDITPIDLFPFRSKAEYGPLPDGFPEFDNFPKALDLKINAISGVYDVVAIYNWLDEAEKKIIYFEEDLGLNPENEYLTFDFWNQKLIGIFKNRVVAKVPPHGVRVFIVKPLTNTPQLMATSRHITGTYSIKSTDWDTTNLTLRGISKTIPNESYSLFIYIPLGVKLSNVDANAQNLTYNINSNRILKISFQGQEANVNWKINFSAQ